MMVNEVTGRHTHSVVACWVASLTIELNGCVFGCRSSFRMKENRWAFQDLKEDC